MPRYTVGRWGVLVDDQLLQSVLIFDGAILRETVGVDAFVARGDARPSYVTQAQLGDYLTAYRRAVHNITDRRLPPRRFVG